MVLLARLHVRRGQAATIFALRARPSQEADLPTEKSGLIFKPLVRFKLACELNLWFPVSMPRRIVILVCCLNILLGIAVLWFILTPKKGVVPLAVERSSPSQKATNMDTADTELWAMAMAAGTAQEAYQHLLGLPEDRATLQQMTEQIGTLVERAPLPFEAWPFYEALVENYGSRAEAADDLLILAQVAAQAEQALALRDSAFRVFIENFGRFEGADAESAFRLIDRLYGEASSLAGRALQAEAFLRRSGVERTGQQLADRATAMLLDHSAIESNRLAAAAILSDMEPGPDVPMLRAAFEGTDSERLQLALLQMLDSALRTVDPSDAAALREELTWLESYRPATPELERTLYRLLEKL